MDQVTEDRWQRPDLSGVVACVTGASYGVGRGIGQVLGQCGATVYVTARSSGKAATQNPEWTVESTAALVADGGGVGVPVAVDHADESQVRDLFARIEAEQRRLDVLVSNVWQWGPRDNYEAPTWEQSVERWDAMIGTALRAHFLTVRHALPLLLQTSDALLVLTQERPGTSSQFGQNVVVDVAAKAMQRLAEYVGHEVDGRATALLLYLGWVRSVNRGMGFDPESVGMTDADFHAATQSPHLIGRAVAALSSDRDGRRSLNGQTIYAGDVANQYGFTDIDGRVPPYETTT
jgi:NAD(P)-dependent dehydrogenase (short-subunit alcohol dehydrogenase family)